MDTRKFFLIGSLALGGAAASEGDAIAQEPKSPPPVVTIGTTGETVKQPDVTIFPRGFFLFDRFSQLVELTTSLRTR